MHKLTRVAQWSVCDVVLGDPHWLVAAEGNSLRSALNLLSGAVRLIAGFGEISRENMP